jgi:uncharacterized OB-fold protein
MTAQEAQTERRMVPLREGLFRLPSAGEEAALIGSRCPDCGKHFFPRRHVCLNCSHEGLDEVPLSRRGKIWTFTVARQTPPASLTQAPYAIGYVELPEGVRVETVLIGDPEAVHIGMDVEFVLEKVGTSADGADMMAFKFRPV